MIATTKDEIIEMAREAGLLVIGTADGGEAVYTWPAGITEEIEAFAKLVEERTAAKEREACAEILDGMAFEMESDYEPSYAVDFVRENASKIRARGEA